MIALAWSVILADDGGRQANAGDERRALGPVVSGLACRTNAGARA
jgi:hypothetical protein